MKTITSLLFRDHSIFVSPLDDEFFLATAIPTQGKFPVRKADRNPETAIALLQREILWTEVSESESPAAIVQLAPYKLIHGNKATGGKDWQGRSLTESWDEAERDRYLMALFRDGIYSGNGVNSERVFLIDGSSFCIEKPQDLSQ